MAELPDAATLRDTLAELPDAATLRDTLAELPDAATLRDTLAELPDAATLRDTLAELPDAATLRDTLAELPDATALRDTLAELPDAASQEILAALGQMPESASSTQRTADMAPVTPSKNDSERLDAMSQAILATLASETRAGQQAQPHGGTGDGRPTLATAARAQEATALEPGLQQARREALTADGSRTESQSQPLDARRGGPLPTTEAMIPPSRGVPADSARLAPTEPPHATAGLVNGGQSPSGAAPGMPLNATGQPAQATLTAPVQSSAWPGQLGQQLVQFARQTGEQQIEMRLHPAELGPLSVTLKVTEQGAHAQFLSAHAPVRQAIEQALPQLREALAEQGIALNDTSVGEQRQQDGQAFAGGDGQAGRGEGGGDVGTEAGPASDAESLAANGTTEVTLDGRVNLYA
ncbi:flagellar hook-length control protein FliK [Billgrantia azerbaijanica]|nr:flagellar hook-length control protein FliK [Halomonas azerbaijanica]